MSKKAKISIGIVIGVLVALIAAFAIYVSYYAVGKKALPGTTVGEVKVSGMTAAQIQRQLEKPKPAVKPPSPARESNKYLLLPKKSATGLALLPPLKTLLLAAVFLTM